MDFSVYEAQLTKRMLLFGISCALLAVVFIICLFFVWHSSFCKSKSNCPKEIIEAKLTQWILCIFCVAGIIGCILLGGSTAWKCLYDINNQAYLVWEGNISVYQDGPTKSRWYLPDEGGIKLEGAGLDEGKYTGTVVYSVKTKIVLEYCIDNTPSNSD